MSRVVLLLVVFALVLAGLLVSTRPLQADASTVFVTETAVPGGELSLTLSGRTLFWFTDCGGEFAPPRSRLRSIATRAQPPDGATDANDVAHTMRYPTNCTAQDRIASANVVIAAGNVYWIDGLGRIMRLPAVASADAPAVPVATVMTNNSANFHMYSLASDGRSLYWSELDRIVRLALDAADTTHAILSGGSNIQDLRSGGGYLFYRDSTNAARLNALLPLSNDPATGYLPQVVADGVAVYTLDLGRVYWGSSTRGPYTIASRPLDLGTSTRIDYQDTGTTFPSQYVDGIAADTFNIYWHLQVDSTGGPIIRKSLAGGVAAPISDYQTVYGDLVSDGGYLLWQDFATGFIRRLVVNADPTEPVTASRPLLRISDVSPDSAYGTPDTINADTGGLVEAVVVDPTNPSVLYATTEFAGVWKSSTGGQTWSQASVGLTMGISSAFRGLGGNVPNLAVDSTDSHRLVYSLADVDYQANSPTTGVYVSNDGALHWQRVTLPNCDPAPGARSVAFTQGHAFVVTRCGLYTSVDLGAWMLLDNPAPMAPPQMITARGQTLFACNGMVLYRSTNLGAAGSWSAAPALPGTCFSVAVAPTDAAVEPAAVVFHLNGTNTEVSLVNFATGMRRVLYTTTYQGSGTSVVFAARRPSAPADPEAPGVSYDVFIGNGYFFLQFVNGTSWEQISNVHADTWSMAFPRTYDPARGFCRAYASTDGGVFVNLAPEGSTSACTTATGPWDRAMTGLHAFASYDMAGIAHPVCGIPAHPCAAIYVPSGDNSTWVSTTGGATPASWQWLGCCGDSGSMFIDQAVKTLAVTARNNIREVYRSDSEFGGPPPTRADDQGNIFLANMTDGQQVPQQATFAIVQTPFGDPPAPHGDFVGVLSKDPATNPPGGDGIVRKINDGGWTEIGPETRLPFGSVQAISVSGGHTAPVIFALVRQGDAMVVMRGQVAATTGRIPGWTTISGPNVPGSPDSASSLFADPFDPNVVYVSGSGAIMSTHTALSDVPVWGNEAVLTSLATANNRLTYGCNDVFCPLLHLYVAQRDPRQRIAVLFPGVSAFSRDGGIHWIPIGERLYGTGGGLSGALTMADLIGHPYSAFFDPAGDPNGTWSNLYLALHGRGMVRMDGPFATLQQVEFQLTPAQHVMAASDTNVDIVDETTNVTIPLQFVDGAYRGSELIDGAGYGRLRFHVAATGQVVSTIDHTLTSAELDTGVTTINVTASSLPPTPTPTSAPSITPTAIPSTTPTAPAATPTITPQEWRKLFLPLVQRF